MCFGDYGGRQSNKYAGAARRSMTKCVAAHWYIYQSHKNVGIAENIISNFEYNIMLMEYCQNQTSLRSVSFMRQPIQLP